MAQKHEQLDLHVRCFYRVRQLRYQFNNRSNFIEQQFDALKKLRFSDDENSPYNQISAIFSFTDDDDWDQKLDKIFNTLIGFDPTGDKRYAHQILTWVLGGKKLSVVWHEQVKQGAYDLVLKPEDWWKIKMFTDIFHMERLRKTRDRTKDFLFPDIQDYRNPHDFITAMALVSVKGTEYDWQPKLMAQVDNGGAIIKGQDQEEGWIVAQIMTEEAAIELGDKTAWCTAYKDGKSYFNDYQDGLFWILNTKTNERYQCSFQNQEFQDGAETADFDFWRTITNKPNLKTRLEELLLENFKEIFFKLGDLSYNTIDEKIAGFFGKQNKPGSFDYTNLFAIAKELYNQGYPHLCIALLELDLPDWLATDDVNTEISALYIQCYDRFIDLKNIDSVVDKFGSFALTSYLKKNFTIAQKVLDKTRDYILSSDLLADVLIKNYVCFGNNFRVFGETEVVKAMLKVLDYSNDEGKKHNLMKNFHSFIENGHNFPIFDETEFGKGMLKVPNCIYENEYTLEEYIADFPIIDPKQFLLPDEISIMSVEHEARNHLTDRYEATKRILAAALERLQNKPKPIEPKAAPG